MALTENSSGTKSKDIKVKVDTDHQGISQKPKNIRKNMDFSPRPNFTGAFEALTGHTFLVNRYDDFKKMLDNIGIFFGVTNGHDMGIPINSCR